MSIHKIAVLLTCHNRREKTLKSLKHLFNATKPNGRILKVFLVDDGSKDGTSDAVVSSYPHVNIIKGSGNLFWNQGMRMAWTKAVEAGEFDYYLWLNDDTYMDEDALTELFNVDESVKVNSPMRVITAACRANDGTNDYSYGGRDDKGLVYPNGKIQEVKYINGNLVLVPREVYLKIGILSPDYTHGIGDDDYGLRTIEAGGKCFTTRKYIATCALNEGIPGWCNPSVSLVKRWKLLHSPKGLNIREYNIFRKRFWGKKWILFALKAYMKTIAPRLYSKLSAQK